MIITDEKIIDDFLDRGVSAIYPNRDFLKKELSSGKQLSIYLGIDPTGPNLHIGHMICLNKLSQFQKLGHKVVFLIGLFTAMIGDPTGKASSRKQLTREDVLNNCKEYKKQASVYLDFEGENPVEMKYNSDWHDKLNFKDIIDIASNFTVSQMIERDMFQERIKNNQPIGLHEFLYPLMQGYDSVAMGVDGEIGGNDQIFNMLAGRDLMKSLKNKEKFVVAMKLLTDSTGKKMGKSEGNMIALGDTSHDMFGKIMSWTDGMILSGFELCTNVSLNDINKYKEDLENGVNPRDLKIKLAEEVVKIYFGEWVAKHEVDGFISQFSEHKLPEDIYGFDINNYNNLINVIKKDEIIKNFDINYSNQFKNLIETIEKHEKDSKKIVNKVNESFDINYSNQFKNLIETIEKHEKDYEKFVNKINESFDINNYKRIFYTINNYKKILNDVVGNIKNLNIDNINNFEKELVNLDNYKKTFSSMVDFKIEGGDLRIVDILVESGLCSSNTEARKMIEQGAVKIYDLDKNMRKIVDFNEIIDVNKENIIQVGKLKYIRIV